MKQQNKDKINGFWPSILSKSIIIYLELSLVLAERLTQAYLKVVCILVLGHIQVLCNH